MVLLGKLSGDLSGQLIGCRLGLRVLRIGTAVLEARKHHRTGDRSAGCLHAAHAESESFRRGKQRLFRHADLLRKRTRHRLCTVASPVMQFDCFFLFCHFITSFPFLIKSL